MFTLSLFNSTNAMKAVLGNSFKDSFPKAGYALSVYSIKISTFKFSGPYSKSTRRNVPNKTCNLKLSSIFFNCYHYHSKLNM